MNRAFFNEYADTNHMTVLRPQATATGFTGGEHGASLHVSMT